jgi:mycothiol synthase
MKPRAYRDERDAVIMANIAGVAVADSPSRVYWHRGDVWWMLYQNMDFDPRTHVTLWEQDGDAVGFDVNTDGTLAWCFLPGVTSVATVNEVLDRGEAACRRLTAGENTSATSLAEDVERVSLLESRGYQRLDRPRLHFFRRLSVPLDLGSPPEAVTIRQVGGEREWPERVAIHREVWHPSKVTLEAYRRLRTMPGYDLALDLVLTAGDGAIAAYCLLWLDPQSGIAEFEPVGTRKAYRRQGLGKALLAGAFQRLIEYGATGAFVCTPASNTAAVRLYESVGFDVTGEEYTYQRKPA